MSEAPPFIDIDVFELRDMVEKLGSTHRDLVQLKAGSAFNTPFRINFAKESETVEASDRLRASFQASVWRSGGDEGMAYPIKPLINEDGNEITTDSQLEARIMDLLAIEGNDILEVRVRCLISHEIVGVDGDREVSSLVWDSEAIRKSFPADISTVIIPRAYNEKLAAWTCSEPPISFQAAIAESARGLDRYRARLEVLSCAGWDEGTHDQSHFSLANADEWLNGIEEAVNTGTRLALELRYRLHFESRQEAANDAFDTSGLVDAMTKPLVLLWVLEGRKVVKNAALAFSPQIYPGVMADFVRLLEIASQPPRDFITVGLLRTIATGMLRGKGERESWEAQKAIASKVCNGWPYFDRVRVDLTSPMKQIEIAAILLHNPDIDTIERKYREDMIEETIKRATKITVVFGAGVSIPAGIKNFRGKGSMTPKEREIFYFATRQNDPVEWRKRMAAAYFSVSDAKPTMFHHWLAIDPRIIAVYSFNVDGLEAKAGLPADKLVQLHGSFLTIECQACGNTSDDPEAVKSTMTGWANGTANSAKCPICEETVLRRKRPRLAEASSALGYFGSSVLLLNDTSRLKHEVRTQNKVRELKKQMGYGGLLVIVGTSLSKEISGGINLVKDLMKSNPTTIYVSPDANEEVLRSNNIPLGIRITADNFVKRLAV